MDIRVQQAREHHRMAASLDAEAGRHRAERDRLIMSLRDEDPGFWTMRKLAQELGCVHQLIAYIINQARRG
jgi:hypothetical protein